MTTDNVAHDPLDFVRNMWGRMGFSLPGMVTPTFDVDELEKRIGDMRAVEGWLKMNLSMLQMAIQGLDMQRAAIAAVHAMSKTCAPDANDGEAAEAAESSNAGNNPFLWPWSMMGGTSSESASAAPEAPPVPVVGKPRAKRRASGADGK